jgi:hypothetical protein
MSFSVDVHHHILPDFFFRETNDAHNPVGGIAPPPWDADLMLVPGRSRNRRRGHLDFHAGVDVGDDARARSLARRGNELSAKLVQTHPNCLGGFAGLPLPTVVGDVKFGDGGGWSEATVPRVQYQNLKDVNHQSSRTQAPKRSYGRRTLTQAR